MKWIVSPPTLAAVLALLGCDSKTTTDTAIDTDTDAGIDTSTDWDTEVYDYAFQDPDLWIEHRVDNIVSLMTLEEKIECLGTNPSVPRLDIVGTGHLEGLHGAALGGPANWAQWFGGEEHATTQFPQAYGLGETWDPDLLRRVGEAESVEARYLFHTYNVNALIIRAPNVDLARDPRWGRTEESFGEDPFLTGSLTVAMVQGLEGEDPHYIRTAALLKHFVANSNEDGRSMTSSDFSKRLLREYYAVPFEMGITEGGAQAFMSAYNLVNDIPCTVHPMMRDIALNEWGLDGIICTDAGALVNLVNYQVYAEDLAEGAAMSIEAGISQFLDDEYPDAVTDALDEGLLDESVIDDAVKRNFRVMIRLGLLDPPERVPYNDAVAEDEPWASAAHKQLAQEATAKSIVLLKNDAKLLPLDASSLDRIAVIGALGNEVRLDWYSGTPPYTVTPLQGIQDAVSADTVVDVAEGTEDDPGTDIAAAADVAVVLVGNHPTCDGAGWAQCPEPSQGREAVDRKEIALDETQEALVESIIAANPRTVVVLISSFPYAIPWISENAPALLHLTHNSQELGKSLADVLFGTYNPAGRLTQTWPTSLDQLPEMLDYDLTDGRTYMYLEDEPLYPFGFGLSYTEFEYSNLRLGKNTIEAGDELTVSVDVKNTGDMDGEEVVQLYVSFPSSKVTRPLRALKGFQRKSVAAGKTETFELPLNADALTYWDEDQGRFVLESGEVTLELGASSADIRRTTDLTVTGE